MFVPGARSRGMFLVSKLSLRTQATTAFAVDLDSGKTNLYAGDIHDFQFFKVMGSLSFESKDILLVKA